MLISNPIMTEDQMARHVEEFNEMTGLRVESCDGILDVLADTWRAAKYALDSLTGLTEDG